MNVRTAEKVLCNVNSGHRVLYRPVTIRESLSIMSQHPELVERIVCHPGRVHFWGANYTVTPMLVHKRFGDGAYWGSLEPLNTRPECYIIMGDSAWRGYDGRPNEVFWYALDLEIYPAIEDEYGPAWDDELGHRGWPAFDDECGCGSAFPLFLAEKYRFLRQGGRWSE